MEIGGKILTLEVGEVRRSDGIEVNCIPENYASWEEIQEIRVRINEKAQRNIREIGRSGTRYNGSDKIEIINGIPEYF